jgi:hypothetical protein
MGPFSWDCRGREARRRRPVVAAAQVNHTEF